MLLGGAINGNAARMPNSWLAVARCTLLLFCCMQACAQLLLSQSNRWQEWREENSNGSWRVYNLSSLLVLSQSFSDEEVVFLNTSSDGSGGSGSQEFYSLINPSYMITSNCIIGISYLLLSSEPVILFVNLNDGSNQPVGNLTNMGNSTAEFQFSLPTNISSSSARLVLSVMVPDTGDIELILVNISECVIVSVVDPSLSTTMSIPAMFTIPFMFDTSSPPAITMSSTEVSMASTTSTSQPIIPRTSVIVMSTPSTTRSAFTPSASSSTLNSTATTVASPPITSLTMTTVTSLNETTSLVMSTTSLAVTNSPVITISSTEVSTSLTTSMSSTSSQPIITDTTNTSIAVSSTTGSSLTTTAVITTTSSSTITTVASTSSSLSMALSTTTATPVIDATSVAMSSTSVAIVTSSLSSMTLPVMPTTTLSPTTTGPTIAASTTSPTMITATSLNEITSLVMSTPSLAFTSSPAIAISTEVSKTLTTLIASTTSTSQPMISDSTSTSVSITSTSSTTSSASPSLDLTTTHSTTVASPSLTMTTVTSLNEITSLVMSTTFLAVTSSPITISSTEVSTSLTTFKSTTTSQPIVPGTTNTSVTVPSTTGFSLTTAVITTTSSSTITTVASDSTMVASSTVSSLSMAVSTTTATSVIDTTSVAMNFTSLAIISSLSSTILPDMATTTLSIASTMITSSLILAPFSSVMTSTPVNTTAPSSIDGEDDSSFFSTTAIIAIATGGGVLLLILFILLCCCVYYRVRVSRRNQKYYISNASNFDHNHKPGHSSHSSVFAQERYRHKSRSTESVMSSPFMYELPHVHVEAGPTNYRQPTGDEDTIDSDSEDIRHDLKGTPIGSRRGSYSSIEHRKVNFNPLSNGRAYGTHPLYDSNSDDNQYTDDNISKTSEISDATVYPNRNLLSEMCGGELPPILSLGDHEDDDDVVLTNPYYVEPKNEEVSPRRSRKRSLDLEALTTLDPNGEHDSYPKQPVYNTRSGAPPSSSKNHKLLRKTKSELNLEDATKIVRNTRYHHPHKHHSKSRIDLREATKIGQSDLAKVSYHHRSLGRQPHYSSSPKILDSRESSSREMSSKLERLTSLT